MSQRLRQFKAELFKAISHPVRIHILELLREGRQSVSELQAEIGIEPSNISQQLAVMRMKNVVVSHKEGSNVYYEVSDKEIFTILDAARRVFDNHLSGLQSLTREPDGEDVHLTPEART